MIETAVQGLFSSICAVAVRIPSSEVESLPAGETEAVRKAAPVRQREFAAGRTAARAALAKIDFDHAIIGVGEDRAPQWPTGAVGSIAHTHTVAVAVVARATEVVAIGVDIEESHAVRAELWSHILGETEQTSIAQLPVEERARWATVIFCAKEAFYKFQYPLTRAWVDFKSVEVTLQREQGRFDLHLIQPVTLNSMSIDKVTGRFAFAGTFTLAGLYLPVSS